MRRLPNRAAIAHMSRDRWLVSYADFMTLLFAFFATMYAISSVDAQKLSSVASALQSAFDDTAKARTTPPVAGHRPGSATIGAATEPSSQEVEAVVSEALAAELASDELQLIVDRRGVTLSIPEAGAFGTGRDELSDTAQGLVARVAGVLNRFPNAVRVEGHTDDVPIHTLRFQSNWDLSAAHAMIDMLTHAEEERLLGRPVETLLTDADRAAFAGKTCLITGAGGTVGAELARQLAACGPKRLVLVEQSELALFRIEQRLEAVSPETAIEPVLCDVTRASSIARVMRRVRPDLVFHAAAYKHVTMAERAICATARVNILGTSAVLAAAREVGARFVLISTDKAAAPHSVMGATKRLAEQVVLGAYADMRQPIVVRFGNVLASSGSFVEVMRERIHQGQPILLTDPNATRFFMTVSEAASLVLKAATLAGGGETFWLDMGPQVRIGDLADRLLDMARDQGLAPVPVQVIGLRPGEKVAEELASQGIRLEKTTHDRVWVAHQARSRSAASEAWLRTLRRAIARDDAYGVMTALTLAIPDFVPSERAWTLAREVKTQVVTTARAARPRPVLRREIAVPRAIGRRAPSSAADAPKLRVVSSPARRAGWLR